MKKRTVLRAAAAVALAALCVSLFGLTGCAAKKYKIDYCGQESFYRGAKKEYAEGETVTLYYDLIATDTDYKFLLDGKEIGYDYDGDRGFVVSFTMPARDVTLKCETKNSMVSVPEIIPDVLLISYRTGTVGTDGGDDEYRVELYTCDRDRHLLTVTRTDAEGNADEKRYYVPVESSEKCYRVIFEREIDKWGDLEDYECIDGKFTEVKYRTGGEYVSANTGKMPYGGEYDLDAVGSMLERYIAEGELVSEETE